MTRAAIKERSLAERMSGKPVDACTRVETVLLELMILDGVAPTPIIDTIISIHIKEDYNGAMIGGALERVVADSEMGLRALKAALRKL